MGHDGGSGFDLSSNVGSVRNEVLLADGWKFEDGEADSSEAAVIPRLPPDAEGCWVKTPCPPVGNPKG
jgi:hypothetical protein